MKLLFLGLLFPIFCNAMHQDEHANYLCRHEDAKSCDDRARNVKVPEYLFMNLVLNAHNDNQRNKEPFAAFIRRIKEKPVASFEYDPSIVLAPEKKYVLLTPKELLSGLIAYVRGKSSRSSCLYLYQVRINGAETPMQIGPNFGNPMIVEAAALRHPNDEQITVARQKYEEFLFNMEQKNN